MKNVSVVHFVTSIRLLLIPAHKSHASSYGNSDEGSPSMEIVKRELSMLLESLFLKSVFTRARAENPHSQSTVDIGNKTPILAMAKLGNIIFISSVFRIWVMSCRVVSCFNVEFAAITLLKILSSSLVLSACTTLCGL